MNPAIKPSKIQLMMDMTMTPLVYDGECQIDLAPGIHIEMQASKARPGEHQNLISWSRDLLLPMIVGVRFTASSA